MLQIGEHFLSLDWVKYLCLVKYVNWKFGLIVKSLWRSEMKVYLVDSEFFSDFVWICTLTLYIVTVYCYSKFCCCGYRLFEFSFCLCAFWCVSTDDARTRHRISGEGCNAWKRETRCHFVCVWNLGIAVNIGDFICISYFVRWPAGKFQICS